MRLSRTSIQTAVAGVALGIAASSASAGLVYDLRVVSGPAGSEAGQTDAAHKRLAIPGTYQVELWARVSGTNAAATDDGISNSYISIVSTQVAGGVVTAGGLAGGATTPTFSSNSRNGGANSITADGIGDWGGTSTTITDTNYMFARTALATSTGELGGGTSGQAFDGGWEFKLATFDLNVISSPGVGETKFNVVKPIATNSGVSAAPYAAYKIDGVSFTANNANQAAQGLYSGSTGISLLPVPEPASLGLLGLAAVGLISRRRR